MRLALCACVFLCFGCGSHDTVHAPPQAFTDSDACKALLRDVIVDDSEFRKELTAEEFVRQTNGDCIIETTRGQLLFNVKQRRFRIVQGVNPKSGSPHEIWGVFFISDAGELRTRFEGQAD
jgi:hypothetical protein